jgi:TolB-like protein
MKLTLLLVALALSATARAQSLASVHTVVVLDVALDVADAPIQGATDSAWAIMATTTLRDSLSHVPRIRVVDAGSVAAAKGQSCNVDPACALAVGKAVQAEYVVWGRLSKTDTLRWTVRVGLLNVATGFEVIASQATAVKGERVASVVGAFAASVDRQLNGSGI